MRIVYLTLGWVAGIVIAISTPALIPLFWLGVLGGGWLALVWLWSSRWRMLGVAIFALALGGYRAQFIPQTSAVANYNRVGNATLVGVIVAEPDQRDDRVQLRLATEEITIGGYQAQTSGTVLVNVPRISDLAYGQRVRVTGRMATPAEFDTFSYADYLAQRDVFSVMYDARVTVLGMGDHNPYFARLLAFKHHLQGQINAALPDPQAALLTGILLGNERGIDPQLREDFNRTGAAHIVAISGFNMALLAGIVTRPAEKLDGRRRWLAVFVGIAIIALYTILVGANVAVVRAAIMSSLLVIAPLFRRRVYVPASLAFVTLVMSAQNPRVLWDVGFQLSLFSVLGLALFVDPYRRGFDALLRRMMPDTIAERVGRVLNEPLIVTLAALTLTLPLTMLYFQRFSLVVLPVNILIVPVQGWLLIIGLLALLVSLVAPAVAQVLFWIDMVFVSWSISIVRAFADFAWADVTYTTTSRFVRGLWIAYSVVIGGAIVYATRPSWVDRVAQWVRQRFFVTTSSVIALCLLVLMVAQFRSRPDGHLHLWWLDVGHSNAVLMQSPRGAHVLIDGGRFPSRLLTAIGDRLPFNDRTIEILALTQPDMFDIGAVPALLSRYQTQVVLTNGQANLGDPYATVQAAIAPYPVVEATSGYTIALDDGTLIEILHPAQPPALTDGINDGSLVLRVRYGDVSVLLAGDLSRRAQNDLLNRPLDLASSVLHLPQHGTRASLSDDFLAAVQPQIVILQSDIANGRNDPDPDTLAQLGDIPLFRTDQQGALHLWTDGETVSILPAR